MKCSSEVSVREVILLAVTILVPYHKQYDFVISFCSLLCSLPEKMYRPVKMFSGVNCE